MKLRDQSIRVLVVDDSPVSRKLLEHTLAQTAYEVVFAKEGADALRVLAERPPDLVIADWELPDISGPEMCRVVRSKFAEAYTYIMLLTSNSDKKSIAEGLASGADDYLTKPFDADELRARLGVGRRVIEMQRQIEAKTKELARESRTDPLTGLANRRAVEEWAARQVAGAVRHGYPIWVILVDIESYKPVRDALGRTAGDAMLSACAEVIKKHTRASDMCGHLGGDQFILVVSHVEKKNIPIVVDRLREKLAACKFSFNGSSAPLLASFGVAGSEGHEQVALSDLLARADAALVQAKHVSPAPPVAQRVNR